MDVTLFRWRRQERRGAPVGGAGHPAKVSVVARWDFDVTDPEAVIATAIARLRATGYDAEEAADHARSVEAALLRLFELDGWEPDYESIGLDFAGSAASTRAITTTIEDGDDAMDLDG